MKSQSTINPSLLIKSQGQIYIVDKSSIIETIETETQSTSYNYDMYELQITERQNIDGYVEQNYDVLLDFAINKYLNEIVKPSTEEISKAQRELEVLNLLSEMGVLS